MLQEERAQFETQLEILRRQQAEATAVGHEGPLIITWATQRAEVLQKEVERSKAALKLCEERLLDAQPSEASTRTVAIQCETDLKHSRTLHNSFLRQHQEQNVGHIQQHAPQAAPFIESSFDQTMHRDDLEQTLLDEIVSGSFEPVNQAVELSATLNNPHAELDDLSGLYQPSLSALEADALELSMVLNSH